MKSFTVILLAAASVSAAPTGDMDKPKVSGLAARGIADAFTGAFQGVVDTASAAAGEVLAIPADGASKLFGARAVGSEVLQDFEKEEEAEEVSDRRALRLRALQDFEKEEEEEEQEEEAATSKLSSPILTSVPFKFRLNEASSRRQWLSNMRDA
ncbi:hypothetical protein ED733_006306 [Metarhizium rileyi]|uniref:Uncharacterized protein n=1 Tax=Metarhizium rileyi (strain RCEF 4871) TaxID=1649241 RepID=A0A5C6GN48_METRR|nr:hypothetical protein ED733_006306 [Metarhizium rileyi]